MPRCLRRNSQRNSRAKGSATPSWPASARSTCRRTVRESLNRPLSDYYYRQHDHLLPERYLGQEEGVLAQRPGQEHPRAAVQELDAGVRDGVHQPEAADRPVLARRARPPEGAEAVDHERLRRRDRRRLQGVGAGAGRGQERPDGAEEGDHDLDGPGDGGEVRSKHPRVS